MNALTVVSTDLLTPLGAYLALRGRGRASFLLESVEHGRLGRYSFVGCGSRPLQLAPAGGGGAPGGGHPRHHPLAPPEPAPPPPRPRAGPPQRRLVAPP